MKFLKRTIPQQEEEQRWFFQSFMILFLSENCLQRMKCDHFCIRTPSLGKTLPFDKSVNRYENISATNILHKSITFSDKHKIFLYIVRLNRSYTDSIPINVPFKDSLKSCWFYVLCGSTW